MTYVAMTMTKFPLLSYVNEPISHFSSGLVRQSAELLGDVLHDSFSVPPNIASAYENGSPYKLDATDITPQSLSPPIPFSKLVINDGDGLVELNNSGQLRNDSIYHRFFAVDAPELYSTNFININGKLFKRRNGHLSHLAVHYYINNFAGPAGTAEIRKQYPRSGQIPTDRYRREITSFWFVWHTSPNASELCILDDILNMLHTQEERVIRRVASNIHPRAATAENPFLVNLNALLVLSGFCHVYTRYTIFLFYNRGASKNCHCGVFAYLNRNTLSHNLN